MNKYCLLGIAALLITVHLMAIDCKSISKAQLVGESDLIFTAIVLEVRPDYFTVRTIEQFKGQVADTMRSKIEPSSVKPRVNSAWLFYGERVSVGHFRSTLCSGSKSFDNPFGYHDYSRPTNTASLKISDGQAYLVAEISRTQAFIELYNELAELRMAKSVRESADQHTQMQSIMKESSKIADRCLSIVWSCVALQIVSVSLLLILLLRSKNSLGHQS